MGIKKYHIARLGKKDVPEIVDVLCDSFANYPVMRFVLYPDADYDKKLKILIHFFVMARIFRNEIILGIGRHSSLEGVALISDPNKSIQIPELNALRSRVWQELGAKAKRRYQQFGSAAGQFKIEVPHLHLNMIGVRNSAQNKGFGRRLIERVHQLSLDDPNSKGISLTTEDPDKVTFYKYLGYEIIDQAVVFPELKTWIFFRPD